MKTYRVLRTTPATWRPSQSAVPPLPQDQLVLALVALSYLLRLLHRFLWVSCRLPRRGCSAPLFCEKEMKNSQCEVIAR